MKITHIKPSNQFSSYIAGYATLSLNHKKDFPFNGSALPDGFVELYFSKHESISVTFSNSQKPQKLHTGFIIGQSNKRIDMIPNGKLEFLQVKIFPWAAKYFLNEKASSYSNKALFISDFEDLKLLKLQEKILNTQTTEESIILIETFLKKSIKEKGPHSMLLHKACNHIFNNKGMIKISELSNKLDISNQYLERLFKEYVGLTPKQLSTVIKIRSLASYQIKNPNISLTQLALEFNYFDQSHFIRDFSNLINETPKVFFKRNDNFVLNYFPFEN